MLTRIYGERLGWLEGSVTYPNVAPDPTMYLPRVRITPLGPAPYWKIVTVPKSLDEHVIAVRSEVEGLTDDEAHDTTDG